jgi:hypothetical protein
MAQLGYTVSTNDLPQDTGGEYSPLPAGDYQVRIVETSINSTKSGTGQYIKLRMDVTGPSHEGRVLFTNLNIKNDSQKAEEIGRQQLGAVMRAIGLESIQDTDQLVGGAMTVKVTIRKSEEYGDQNEVKAFKAIAGSKPPAPTATGGQNEAAASKPPWAK